MKSSKKKALTVTLGAILMVVTIGITYAFITQTLTGSKEVVINAGVLDLVLEEENEITISGALPMYDEVGMIQDEVFVFRLINKTANPTNYVLKMTKIASDNELSTSDVKYYLTKEGVGEPALLSSLSNGTIDKGTITGNDTIEYTLRLWIRDGVTDVTTTAGKSLSYKLKLEAGQEGAVTTPTIPSTITFGGITESVNTTAEETMFNYSSEGCILDMTTGEQSCPAEPTNGIYAMEDDDGTSYYYRGEVNNLVKFGSYTKDYYVYRYSGYDFPSLEACKYYSSSCSEDNKVLKYAASDNVPMYWRIVRVNGDGTIRMIYAGTTQDAEGQELGIGLSRYNEEYNDPKYAGYTYDKLTTETKSSAKTEIDNWYTNNLEGTVYDSDITTGKFCSDSSGYDTEMGTFASVRRNFPSLLGLSGNSSPTFKCSNEMDENFGGSYNLKAGLMAIDEMVTAGGQVALNQSNFLFDSQGFWSLSPFLFNGDYVNVGGSNCGLALYTDADSGRVDGSIGSLRPVINLRADITFKSGTDGSVLAPYELAN